MAENNEAGHIGLGLSLEAPGMNKQITNMANSASKMAKKAFSMVGTAMGIATMGAFVKQCIDAGSNLAEVQNVVDNSFKTMANSVNEFAKTAIDQFGLSETVAKQYMGTIGAMNNAFGFTEKQSFDMAKAVTGLTGDVASFYNLQSDEAFNKLKGIWTGETEALKSLGVVMTQTALDEYALNNGLGKTTAKMTEQEKVMLRYQYVTNALNTAAGDFSRTQDGWANQTRILSLRFESLKATLGQGFINLFAPIIKSVNTLIASLQVLAEQFNKVTAAIMGTSTTTGISTITTESIEAAESVDKIGDSAVSAAKKANKALAGFDMLNNLSTADNGVFASTAGGVKSEIIPGDIQEDAEGMTVLSKAAENFKKIIEDIKNIASDFKIGDFFSAGKDVSKLTADIFDFASDAIKSVDWKKIGANIGDFLAGLDWKTILKSVGRFIWTGINAALDFYAGMFDAAPIETALITFFALGGGGLLKSAIGTFAKEKIVSPLSTGIVEAIANLGGISGLLTTDISTIMGAGTFSEIGIAVFTGIVGSIAAAFVGFDIGKEIGNWIFGKEDRYQGNLWEQIKYVFTITPEEWAGLGQDWLDGFNSIVDSIKDWWANTDLVKDFKQSGEQLKEDWKATKEFFTTDIPNFVDTKVKPLFTKDKWAATFAPIKNSFQEKWESARDWWNNSWSIKTWNSAKKFFNESKWGNTFIAIKDSLVKVWRDAIAKVKEVWNGFAGWINDKSKVTIAGTTTQLVNIPQFATGGIVDTPTLAMVGEAGKEAVMPLENNTGWISKLADEIARRGGTGNGGADYSRVLMQILEVLIDILEKDTGISQDDVFKSVRTSVTQFKKMNGSLPW